MSAKKCHWMFDNLKYSKKLNLYCSLFRKGKIPFACIGINPFRDEGNDARTYMCTFCDKPQFETKFLKSKTLQDAKKEVEDLAVERLAERIISLRNEIEEIKTLIEGFIQEVENDKQ